MTSVCSDSPDFRVTMYPSEKNGLRVISQVMADKPVTVRRDDKDVSRLNIALAFVIGLAD